MTLLQSIRVLVELVLFWLARNHMMPGAITFEGKNFDILTGLSVPFIYYFGFIRKTMATRWIILWNWMGMGLLLVAVSIGLSSLLSIGQATAAAIPGQSPLAIQQFPWSLLPGFLVPIVFFAHLGSLRQLAKEVDRHNLFQRPEFPRPVFLHGRFQLGCGIHNKGSIMRDRLIDRLSAQQIAHTVILRPVPISSPSSRTAPGHAHSPPGHRFDATPDDCQQQWCVTGIRASNRPARFNRMSKTLISVNVTAHAMTTRFVRPQ